MNISVDFNGIDEMKETRTYNMSRLAFVKHLAVAEQGYQPSLHKLLRTFSRFVLFSPYLKKEAFRGNNFVLPPNIYWDSIDRSLFYRSASIAIADFLA